MKIPKLKKSIKSFLLGEEGKITKAAIVKAGILISSVAGFSALNSESAFAKHGNVPTTVCGFSCHASDHTGAFSHASNKCTIDRLCHQNIFEERAGPFSFWKYFQHTNDAYPGYAHAHGSTTG